MNVNHDLAGIRDNAKEAWIRTINDLDNKYNSEIDFLLDWVSDRKSVFKQMLRGEGKKPSNNQISKIPILLSTLFDKDPKKVKRHLNVIRRLMINGNEIGIWKSYIPGIPTVTIRDKNKHKIDHISNIEAYKWWKSVLSQSLKNTEKMSKEEKIGQILFSSILNGAILDIQTLHSFYKSIKDIYHIDNHLFIEIRPKWQGSDDTELRRYFLDIITINLILKSSDIAPPKNITTKRLFSYISQFLVGEGYRNVRDRPNSLSAILNFSKAHYLDLSGNIVDYASRKFLSHSLKETALKRVISKDPRADERKIDLSEKEIWKKSKSKKNGDFTSDDRVNDKELDDYPWLGKIIKIFENKNGDNKLKEDLEKELKSNLDNYEINSPTLEHAIYKWCYTLFRNSKLKKKYIHRKTVKRYVSLISYGLIEFFGSTHLGQISAEAFEHAYSEILDYTLTNGQRRKTAHALNKFHKFLAENFNIPKINYKDILSEAYSPVFVDANIISEDIFQSCLSALDSSGIDIKHPDLLTCLKIIFILGYRCGLRRNEALKLRMVDISGRSEIHLHIVDHEFRALKTKNSQRKIILNWFLSDNEMRLIRNWLNKKDEEGYSEFLFSIPDLKYTSLHEDVVFHTLHKIMRSVSGDPNMRFHNLRHSFATMTLLKLETTNYPAIKEFFKNSPLTYDWLSDGINLRNKIYNNIQSTRRDLFLISEIMGHCSPKVTEEHYIHCFDILLSVYRDDYNTISINDVVSSSPLPKSTSYRLVNNSIEKYTKSLIKKQRHYLLDKVSNNKSSKENEKESRLIIDSTSIKYSSIDIYKLLLSHFKHDLPVDQLSRKYSFTPLEINQWIKDSNHIFKINSKNNRSYKLRYIKINEKVLPIQRTPKKKYEKELAYIYCDKILNLPEEQSLELLNIFYMNTWKSKYQFVLKSNEKIKYILNFISSLGIDKSYIKYTHLYGGLLQDIATNQGFRYWSKSLKEGPIITHSCLGKNIQIGKHGYLGINVLDADKEASEAFRFAFTLALIVFFHKMDK